MYLSPKTVMFVKYFTIDSELGDPTYIISQMLWVETVYWPIFSGRKNMKMNNFGREAKNWY